MDLVDKSGKIYESTSTIRGKKINEILKDLKDTSLDSKEKLNKYSEHLSWCMDKIRMLFIAQETMVTNDNYKKSVYSVGLLNGIIMGMAIFVEDDATPPYMKIPEKLKGDDQKEIVDKMLLRILTTIVQQLESVICLTHDGKPKGYEKFKPQEAWLRWHEDTINYINGINVDIPAIQSSIEHINAFQKEIEKMK